MAGVWENIGIAVGTAAPVTLLYFANEWRKWAEAKRKAAAKASPPLEDLGRIDAAIHDVLRQAGEELSAQRVYFSRLHNGDYFDPEEPDRPGSSIWRKTRTHEWVKAGVAYQSELYRGMVISSVQEEMDLVRAEGAAWTPVADLRPSKFRWLCEQGGVTSVARCAVHKSAKRIIGFVGADFDRPDCVKPGGVDRLCDYARIVEQLLLR